MRAIRLILTTLDGNANLIDAIVIALDTHPAECSFTLTSSFSDKAIRSVFREYCNNGEDSTDNVVTNSYAIDDSGLIRQTSSSDPKFKPMIDELNVVKNDSLSGI